MLLKSQSFELDGNLDSVGQGHASIEPRLFILQYVCDEKRLSSPAESMWQSSLFVLVQYSLALYVGVRGHQTSRRVQHVCR